MALPLVPIFFAASAGLSFITGRWSRQGEIDRLKKQIANLKLDLAKAQAKIAEQERQLNELNIRFKALKFFHFMEKNEIKASMRAQIAQRCAYKEYLSITIKGSQGVELGKQEVKFCKIYEFMANGMQQSVSGEDKEFFRDVVFEKYSTFINNCQSPEIDSEMQYIANFAA